MASSSVSSVSDALLVHLQENPQAPTDSHKVSIVGCGAVGMACAFSLVQSGVAPRIALMDIEVEKVAAEAADLRHGAAFVKPVTIESGGDASVTAGSSVVIVTAGSRQRSGESRLDLLQRNWDIFQKMIPPLLEASPDAVVIVISNPCDIMTAITARIAKKAGWPTGRVFGSGTCLDSSRFRSLLSAKLGVASSNVHGYILGEHGDSSVPVWSQVLFGGLRLAERLPGLLQDGEQASENPQQREALDKLRAIPEEVVQAAYKIIEAKGFTNWAIGLASARLAEIVLRNDNALMPVSVPAKGFHGIEQDVYLSLPAVIGGNGISAIVNLSLSEKETRALQKSAKAIHDAQAGLPW